jgi:hypothetical protein
MSEKIPASESIPNEREVLNQIERIIGDNFEITCSLEDEAGIYMLEVRTVDEAGDSVQYNYIRVGRYPEGSSSETVIDVVFFSGDVPVGGHVISKYVNGEWVQESVE